MMSGGGGHGSIALLTVIGALTLALVAGELVVGHISHSLTLMAVTNQSIYNLLTIIFATVGKTLTRQDSSLKTTFGWARVEVLGCLFSLVFLGSLHFATSIEAIQSLFGSDHLDTMHESVWVGVVAGCHVVQWLFAFCTIGGYTFQQYEVIGKTPTGDPSLKIPGSSPKTVDGQEVVGFSPGRMEHILGVPFAYVFRDLFGCVLLLVVAAVMYYSSDLSSHPGLRYLDPTVSLVSVAMLVWSSRRMAVKACLILLQTIPDELDVNELRREIFARFPDDVLNAHELHVWCLVPGQIVVTMHIIFQTKESYTAALPQIESYLKSRGVTSWTIQPEIAKQEVVEERGGGTAAGGVALCGRAGRQQQRPFTERQCLLRCKTCTASTCCK